MEQQSTSASQPQGGAFQRLVRKLHIYAGMFSLLFVIFFSVSGFVLNHRWKVWDWFSNRVESTRNVVVQMPSAGSDLEKARAILGQLGVDGEIHRIVTEPAKQTFSFNVQRPGQFAEIKLDASGKGTLKTSDFNAWSIVHIMHTFSGHGDKNWKWANVWKFFSDMTAIITVVLAISGFYLWLKLKTARRWGLIFLELGAAVFILLFWALSKFNL